MCNLTFDYIKPGLTPYPLGREVAGANDYLVKDIFAVLRHNVVALLSPDVPV